MESPSASRVLGLIEWLADQTESVSLAQATAAQGLPKSSVHVLLSTLVNLSYVGRDGDGRYRLDRLPGEISPLGNPAWNTLLRVGRPFLATAVEATGESGFLAVFVDNRIHYLNKLLPASRELKYDRDISKSRLAHHVASGLAILARLPDARVNDYLHSLDERMTEPGEIDRLRATLASVRQEGVAVNLDGRVEGAAGVAAVIVWAAGNPIAAINLAGPRERVAANLDAVKQTVRETADCINRELACRLPPIRRSRHA